MEKQKTIKMKEMKKGSNRSPDNGKLDFEGFFSPIVLYRCAEYMHKHRVTDDGKIRDSDNWQKGMDSTDDYMKPKMRHILDTWLLHRGYVGINDDIEETLCAELFNTMGYLYELLKKRGYMSKPKTK